MGLNLLLKVIAVIMFGCAYFIYKQDMGIAVFCGIVGYLCWNLQSIATGDLGAMILMPIIGLFFDTKDPDNRE